MRWSSLGWLVGDAADVGVVAGAGGALGAAPVERAQDPAPVALDKEPDDGFLAAAGVAHRDEAAVRRGLGGIDPDVVAHPDARGHDVLGDAHDERLAAERRPPGSALRRRRRARGSRNRVWGGCHTSAPVLPAHRGAPQGGQYFTPTNSRSTASR